MIRLEIKLAHRYSRNGSQEKASVSYQCSHAPDIQGIQKHRYSTQLIHAVYLDSIECSNQFLQNFSRKLFHYPALKTQSIPEK